MLEKRLSYYFHYLVGICFVSGHQKTWENFSSFPRETIPPGPHCLLTESLTLFLPHWQRPCFEPLSGARRHKYTSFFCLRGWSGCGRTEENAHQRYIGIGPWHTLYPGRLEITLISGWTALFRKMLMSYNSGKFVVWLWGEFCGLKQINILYWFWHVISMLWLCTKCNKTVDVLLEE